MKMRAICGAVVLALIPAMAQAREPKKDNAASVQGQRAPSMKIVRLTERDLDRAMPQLQAELAGKVSADNAAPAMSKTDYTDVKNALMVARLDFRDPSRMVGPDDPRLVGPDDPRLADIRRQNVSFYKSNEARLEQVVKRLVADRSCSLCGGRAR